jgi:hypothetical protein
MDKEKVSWIIENMEILISMLKEEVKPESNDFQTFLPPDLDDDIEYYEED